MIFDHRRLVVVGGKGRRVGRSGEVYSVESNSWVEMSGDTPAAERSYNVAVLRKPWSWTYPT